MRMADARLVSHYLKVTHGNGLSLLLVLSFAPRGFFWVLQISPLLKNLHFQIDQESGRRRTTLWMCYLQIIIYLLFIYELVGIQKI